MMVKKIRYLLSRLNYRLAFFFFLRKIENWGAFIYNFPKLLLYKLDPMRSTEEGFLVKIFGKKFWVRDLTDLLVIKETFYENCYQFLFEKLDEPTTLIDLGSYIGDVVVYAQDYKMIEQILAIEPDPRNYEFLEKNVLLNKIKNTKTIDKAISETTGEAIFRMGHEGIASSLQEPKVTKKIIKVKTVSLADIIGRAKKKKIVLKSDCEGAEFEIIMKTPLSVLRKIERMEIEYHMSKAKLRKMLARLAKAGFKFKYKDLILEKNVGMIVAARGGVDVPEVRFFYW